MYFVYKESYIDLIKMILVFLGILVSNLGWGTIGIY